MVIVYNSAYNNPYLNFDTPANFKKKLNEFMERNNSRPITGMKLPKMRSNDNVDIMGNTL